MAAMARNPSGMMVELTASRPAHGDKVYLSRTRSTSCTSRKASRRSLEEGRTGARIRAHVETLASLPTARVVDIGYCGYSEPFGGAGEGHTGLRLGLASPYHRIR